MSIENELNEKNKITKTDQFSTILHIKIFIMQRSYHYR